MSRILVPRHARYWQDRSPVRNAARILKSKDRRCPCPSGTAYAACCGLLHGGTRASDAESLMRSRYSAYVLGLRDYVLATWHPDTRPPENVLEDGAALTWLGLAIKRHDTHPDGSATVEFVARHRRGGGPAVRMHEISRFVREDGRWFYLEGSFPDAVEGRR